MLKKKKPRKITIFIVYDSIPLDAELLQVHWNILGVCCPKNNADISVIIRWWIIRDVNWELYTYSNMWVLKKWKPSSSLWASWSQGGWWRWWCSLPWSSAISFSTLLWTFSSSSSWTLQSTYVYIIVIICRHWSYCSPAKKKWSVLRERRGWKRKKIFFFSKKFQRTGKTDRLDRRRRPESLPLTIQW